MSRRLCHPPPPTTTTNKTQVICASYVVLAIPTVLEIFYQDLYRKALVLVAPTVLQTFLYNGYPLVFEDLCTNI